MSITDKLWKSYKILIIYYYGKDIDKIELKKFADINEATFRYVEKEDVIETFKALFDANL